MRLRSMLLVLVISLGLVLTACGSSGGSKSTATSSAAASPPTATTNPPPATNTAGAAETSPTESTVAASPTLAATPTVAEGSKSTEKVKVKLALAFVPNVQFAPFYLAIDNGYYADAGFDVEVQQGPNPDVLAQVGNGDVDFAVTGGDALIPARVAGVPVRYVMAQFEKYPVGATAIATNGVKLSKPEDLKGLKVGVSQTNGSTYFGLLALLQAGGLTLDDIQVVTIGFTELEALTQKRVDAAMTFLVNEPVQAKEMGYAMEELPVSDYVNMVSTGLVTSDAMIKDHPELVQAFVAATLKGLKDSLDNPDAAFDASMKRMPEITGDKVRIQRAVLEQAQKWQQPLNGHSLGWTDPDAWKNTQDLLKSVGIIDKTVDLDTLFTNEFVQQAAQ